MRFTPSEKVLWDPRDEPPALKDDQTAVVQATDLDSIQRAFQWLVTGMHPFKSVVVDSLTEAQKRAIDAIAGQEQLQIRDYGTLLRKMEGLVRAFRDLTMHAENPVQVVVFVCGSAEKGQDHPVVRPALVGRMAEQLAYFVDTQAYLTVTVGPEGELERRALFVPINNVAAKDRTGRLGTSMQNPTVPEMLRLVYGEGDGTGSSGE